jgi:hypothetical protein
MKNRLFLFVFLLLGTIAFGQFTLVYPTAPGITLRPCTPIEVRWSGGNQAGNVRVEFSSNNGATYSRILANNVPNSTGRVIVLVPNVLTSTARFRARLSLAGDTGTVDQSANPVVISSVTSYCRPSAMLPANAYISNVQFRNTASSSVIVQNSSTFFSGTGSGFVDYTGALLTTPSFRAGSSYSLRVSAVCPAGVRRTLAVWCDYNNDGTFQTSEQVRSFTVNTSTSTYDLTISIPTTASLGIRRLRIRFVGGGISSSIATGAACLTSFSTSSPFSPTTTGETEDYHINITSLASPASIAADLDGEKEISLSNEPDWRIFPNPVNANEPISFLKISPESNSVIISISDLQGREVSRINYNENEPLENASIRLPKGMYIFRSESGEKRQTEKIIVR